MSTNLLPYLNQIAGYLKISPGKLTIEANQLPVCTRGNKAIYGFFNIVLDYLDASKLDLLGTTKEDKAEIIQWVEYAIVNAIQCTANQSNQQILGEINEVLSTRTYFVSHQLSIADIVLYYILLNVMQNISYLDKEKYINLSRWFDNLQQDSALRQKNKMVDFNTSFLATLVPARH